jgi:hypothetical protein
METKPCKRLQVDIMRGSVLTTGSALRESEKMGLGKTSVLPFAIMADAEEIEAHRIGTYGKTLKASTPIKTSDAHALLCHHHQYRVSSFHALQPQP